MRRALLSSFVVCGVWLGLTAKGVALSEGGNHSTLNPSSTNDSSSKNATIANPPSQNPPAFHAQTPPTDPSRPDSDFLQPAPLPSPVSPSEEVPITPEEPLTPPAPPPAPVRILVQRIEVIGSTVFDEADFAPVVQPFEGQSLTLEELQQIADAITQLYLDRGYITSRAVLVDQVITDGVVQIRVIEGSLESIDIEGTERVNPSYIRDRIQLGGDTPLSQAQLEDQLRLLRIDPLFETVEASLRAGSGLGQSILTVRVTEADPVIGFFGVDNYSPPDVGSERTSITLGYRSLTGNGDVLLGSYYRSTTGGSEVFDLLYQIPVNPMNGTVQLRASPSNYEITDSEFSGFEPSGSSVEYEVSFRQPVVRSPREELAFSLGLNYQDGDIFLGDIFFSDSTTSVIKLGQDYVYRDPQGAWALRSQFNVGTDWFDATTDADPNGQFVSWLGQVQRVQILDQNNVLIIQADAQFAFDALPGSQQFVIGGGQSVRGYRQNIRIGDNGVRLSVEDRVALQRNEAGIPTLQLTPFVDLGAVWNHNNNPIELPDQTFLFGIGLGVLWEPLPGLNIRLDYGVPLVDLTDRGDNAQDDGFFFNIYYQL